MMISFNRISNVVLKTDDASSGPTPGVLVLQHVCKITLCQACGHNASQRSIHARFALFLRNASS